MSLTFCSGGEKLNSFSLLTPRQQNGCRLGNIGGLSVPFEYVVTYGGPLSLVLGQQVNVTTGVSCNDPTDDQYFLVLGEFLGVQVL